MSVVQQIVPRSRARLTAWIGGPRPAVEATPCEPPEDTATLVARRTYAEAGEFLFSNGLAPTASNFDVAMRYVAGSDHRVGEKVRALLQEHARLTEDMVDGIIAATTPKALTAEAVGELADRLQGRLDECVGLIDRSSASASSYGTAFNEGVARLDAGHADAVSDLRATAQDLVRTTRDMQDELNRHRQETSRLRTELQRARREAERDHLTGLPNRRCFAAKVRDAGKGGDAAVVALCDIDDFKAINDEHGHPTGDRVLKLVAGHLEKELKGKAFVARYGGEEFALYFARTDAAAAGAAIDQARGRLASRSLVDQESGRTIRKVTFSAGVAPVDEDIAAALRAADQALYRAKHLGKDRVMLSDETTVPPS